MKLVSKKDSAVSPVIGTILLVAITVILVAIIAAVVMPMVSGTTGAATVGVQVVPSATAQQVDVTFTGGDYAKITALKLGDQSAASFNDISGSTAPVLGKKYTSSGATYSGVKDVILIATINGNDQIIWQGKLTFPAST
ncbi:MAG TPA: type IV pilin [Methanocorpusculum sp.]|nr:type IV pilin [Methanocorpusculum sp.]